MPEYLSIPPERAEQWDRLADSSQPEYTPDELPDIGGLEYYVVSRSTGAPKYSFGGYDVFQTDDQEVITGVESHVFVSEELPKHVRGLLVGHILLHKVDPDSGDPHLCGHLDRAIHRVLAEAEPSLIEPFYNESSMMYGDGLAAYAANPNTPALTIARYKAALKNSSEKHNKALASTDRRQRLVDAGLVLPDGELALTGVDQRNGLRTSISLQTEAGSRHRCGDCSHPIVKGTPRITTSTKQKDGPYDHRHYHPGCFKYLELGVFGSVQQIPHEEALPNFLKQG